VIDRAIFKELGPKRTFYRNDTNYLRYPNLVDTYWDVLNTGRPANSSRSVSCRPTVPRRAGHAHTI
jgi:hypothetical protein